MSAEQRERKNNRIAWATSLAVHTALFIAFLFAVAWRAPDPPLPEVGIQLNFGLDTQGSGDVQPETPVGTEEKADQTEEVKSEEQQEEVVSETKPAETKPVEQQVTSKQESPVTVKEEKKEVEKPKEKIDTKTEVKESVKKEEKALYKPGEKTETKTGKPGNQGDDAGKIGDKGDPKGSLDSKALYGKQGGGDGGFSYQLDGWVIDKDPKPNDKSNETGILRFEIYVDDQGEVTKVLTKESGVSPEIEKIYKDELYKITFTRKSDSGPIPQNSKGMVTFKIRAQ